MNGPSSNERPDALPTACGTPDGLNYPQWGKLTSPENAISPVALKWLQDHRQALRQAGWTGRELFRRNKSKGICWCSLWEQPFLKVYLHDNGVIEFECVIAGKDIIQTARPMKQARKLQGDRTK